MPDDVTAPADTLETVEEPAAGPASIPPGTDAADQIRRLRRIEGQVRGVQRMVEQGSPCLDVLTQISAVTRALQAVALAQLDTHLRTGLAEASTATPESAAARLDELSTAIARLVRS